MLSYRLCVVGAFLNEEGSFLVGKRKDRGGWQFPQGGVEVGESLEQALFREMREEIGAERFSIIKQTDSMVTYDFPQNLESSIAKKHIGQSRKWFLCKFHTGYGPRLDLATDDEFVEIQWVDAKFIIENIVYWKLEAYKQAFSLLGIRSHSCES